MKKPKQPIIRSFDEKLRRQLSVSGVAMDNKSRRKVLREAYSQEVSVWISNTKVVEIILDDAERPISIQIWLLPDVKFPKHYNDMIFAGQTLSRWLGVINGVMCVAGHHGSIFRHNTIGHLSVVRFDGQEGDFFDGMRLL